MEELEPRLALSVVHWDGGGGDHQWLNPLNWSGDALPNQGSDVVIDASAGSVQFPGDVTTTSVHSMWCGAPLTISGGDLLCMTTWRQAAPLAVSGGALFEGAGGAVLIINSDVNWTGGTISFKTQVLAGRTLIIAGDVNLDGSLINAGTVAWNSGNLQASSILNLPGALFRMRSPGTLSGGGVLTNQGLILRDGSAGTTSTVSMTLANHPGAVTPALVVGVVDARSGTLSFTGAVAQRIGDTLVGGRWVVENTGTLLLPGGDLANVTGGLSEVLLIGPGASFPAIENASSFRILTLMGGRAFTFENATDAAMLTLVNPGTTAIRPMLVGILSVNTGTVVASGTLAQHITIGAGAVLTLTGTAWLRNSDVSGAGLINVVGSLEWISGVVAGPGQMLIAPGGTLHLRTDPTSPLVDSSKWLTRRTVNYGTIEWDDASGWGFQLGTELVNRGTLNLDTTGYLSTTAVGFGSVPAYITNFGTINKGVAGDLTLRGAGGGVRLGNLGTVNVGAGRLLVAGGAGASGSWQVAPGTELVFGGLSQWLTGAVMGGFGRIRLAGNAVWDNVTLAQNGDLVITPVATVLAVGSADWSRSVIYVQGSLYIGSGADIRLHGNVVNTGRLGIDAGAVGFEVTGDVALMGSSVLATGIASGTQFGKLTVNGDIALGGQMFGAFSYPAETGIRFNFIHAATFSGAFSSFGTSGLPAGRSIQWQWIHQGLFDEIGQVVVV